MPLIPGFPGNPADLLYVLFLGIAKITKSHRKTKKDGSRSKKEGGVRAKLNIREKPGASGRHFARAKRRNPEGFARDSREISAKPALRGVGLCSFAAQAYLTREAPPLQPPAPPGFGAIPGVFFRNPDSPGFPGNPADLLYVLFLGIAQITKSHS